jgi:hypothetical protein
MQTQKQHDIGDSFRGLAAAVISRALADIAGGKVAITASGQNRDEAMAWINSPHCEAFCYAIDTDYRSVKEKAVALYRRFLEREDRESRRPGCRKTLREGPERTGTEKDTFFAGKPRSGTYG